MIQCLLWRRINQIKEKLLSLVKKSFHEVPLNWLLKRLGFEEQGGDEWINIKQTAEPLQGGYMGYQSWIKTESIR